MHLLADAGSLTSKKYGTGIVTQEILKAWSKSGDTIVGYAHAPQDQLPAIFWKQASGPLWKASLAIEGLIGQYDGFLALNQYIPPLAPGKVVAFSHGLSFMRYPKLYPEAYGMLKKQMVTMARRANCIVTSSIRVKKEWKKYTGRTDGFVTVPFGIPTDLRVFHAQRYRHPVPYMLYVGMDHPIKRINRIVSAFSQVYRSSSAMNLILVGVPKDRWRHPGIVVVPYADRKLLARLYKGAQALVTMSAYESGNLPVIEALSLGCPVIGTTSALIPELRPFCSLVQAGEMAEQMKESLLSRRKMVSLRARKRLTDLCSWKKVVSEIRETIK